MSRFALLLLLAGGAGGAGAAAVQVDPAFGYRIGDRVVAVSRLEVDAGAHLDAESLPKTGRVNGWLSLDEVRVRGGPDGWEVVRTFQVTASAPEPRMLFLPKASLTFRLGGGRELAEQLDSVPILVSPLTATEPILRNGFGALRPDRDVPEPDARKALGRAGMLAVALAVLALLWVVLRGFAMRRPGFAPFGLAAGKLRRLARGQRAREDPDGVRQAYRILHDAFNQAAGRALFASQKEAFLASHPRFAAEAAAVRAFFERSEESFFGTNPLAAAQPVGSPGVQRGGAEVAWLAGLAHRLARLEQPGR